MILFCLHTHLSHRLGSEDWLSLCRISTTPMSRSLSWRSCEPATTTTTPVLGVAQPQGLQGSRGGGSRNQLKEGWGAMSSYSTAMETLPQTPQGAPASFSVLCLHIFRAKNISKAKILILRYPDFSCFILISDLTGFGCREHSPGGVSEPDFCPLLLSPYSPEQHHPSASSW